MRQIKRDALIVTWLLVLSGCAGGAMGLDATMSDPDSGAPDFGSLVDHRLWLVTDAGTEFFGPPEAGAECEAVDGEGYGFELLGGFEVFSVSTVFCNYITVTQPSLRAVRTGDALSFRFRHGTLTFPVGAEANAGIVLGDTLVWQRAFPIPAGSAFVSGEWVATTDFPAGTPILFHIDNHGSNGYSLIDLEVLP